MSCREWGASCSVYALPRSGRHEALQSQLEATRLQQAERFDISRFLLERCHAVKPCQTSSGGGPK